MQQLGRAWTPQAQKTAEHIQGGRGGGKNEHLVVREAEREAGQSRGGGRTCSEVRDQGACARAGGFSCLEGCWFNVVHLLGCTQLSSYSPYFLPKPFHTSLVQRTVEDEPTGP